MNTRRLFVLVLMLATASTGNAQGPVQRHLQVGGGFVPGLGMQVGYLSAGDFLTTEVTGYLSLVPALLGGESTLRLSLGAGSSLRILHILNMAGTTDLPFYQLDAGLRLGPSFFHSFDGGGAENVNPFSLFVEPYLRGVREYPSGRKVFLELGFHPPLLRGGLWIEL